MAAIVSSVLRDDDHPWQKMAREELDDDPAIHDNKLFEMKQRLQSYQEKHPKFQPQTDDDFLLAFLRTRKFHVKKAFEAFVNYHSIRLANPEMLIPRGKGPADYIDVVREGIVTVLSDRNPIDCTAVCLVSLKNFSFENSDVSHILNIMYYLSRIVLRSPSFQTLGVRLVIDIEGVSMSFFTTLLRRFYNLKAVIIAQGCFPLRIKGIHVMNEYYGMVKHVYSIVWPFLSTKMRKRVHLHGTKYNELHTYVSPDILPVSMKGTLDVVQFAWFEELLLGVHDEMVQDSHYGYLES